MKYWRGYLTAAILGFFSWALMEFAKTHSALIDVVYPYVTRMAQTVLAEWSSGVAFCLWQFLAITLVVGILTTIVLMIVLRWNPIQLVGWYAAAASLLLLLHTAIFGLNGYAGSISDDIRLNMTDYTLTELEDATAYYRDKANELAWQIDRNADNSPAYPDFDELALMAEDGFHSLVYDHSYSIFAGSTLPVKQLGWADMYTSMGITGFTMALTGEAAVNPQIPVVSLPFTMCHEMAHRMCIATESDANMAAFLACEANPSMEYQYSAYFMAYRYCYNAIARQGTAESQEATLRLRGGMNDYLLADWTQYDSFFAQKKDETATKVADTVNDTYIKAQGDDRGLASYGAVCDMLVSWHIQTVVLPTQAEEETLFDPFDETQVDLSGMVNGPDPVPTEPVVDENDNADDAQ